jgi:hypothetical protein
MFNAPSREAARRLYAIFQFAMISLHGHEARIVFHLAICERYLFALDVAEGEGAAHRILRAMQKIGAIQGFQNVPPDAQYWP